MFYDWQRILNKKSFQGVDIANKTKNKTMKYYASRTIKDSFENTENRMKEALTKEGFGINAEINIGETFKEVLGKEFRQYKILGACNPENAFEGIQAEPNLGVMLPCNVLLQEKQPGEVQVSVVDPVAVMEIINNETVTEITKIIRERLNAALENA